MITRKQWYQTVGVVLLATAGVGIVLWLIIWCLLNAPVPFFIAFFLTLIFGGGACKNE